MQILQTCSLRSFIGMNDNNEGNSDMASAYTTVKIQTKVKFIMDTGCGYHLIPQRKARELDLMIFEGNDRMVFMTANNERSR